MTDQTKLRDSYVLAIAEIERDRSEAAERYEVILRVLRERLAALGDGEITQEKK